jgi:YD repeat-containing protein
VNLCLPEIAAQADVEYGFDLDGNLTSISSDGKTRTYGYDALSRLVLESPADGPQVAYGFEPRGFVVVAAQGTVSADSPVKCTGNEENQEVQEEEAPWVVDGLDKVMKGDVNL